MKNLLKQKNNVWLHGHAQALFCENNIHGLTFIFAQLDWNGFMRLCHHIARFTIFAGCIGFMGV